MQSIERKTMNEILNNWEKDKPYILGAIFKILSKTIKLYESGIPFLRGLPGTDFPESF